MKEEYNEVKVTGNCPLEKLIGVAVNWKQGTRPSVLVFMLSLHGKKTIWKTVTQNSSLTWPLGKITFKINNRSVREKS